MGWKKLPAWTKGGIIGGILALIVIIFRIGQTGDYKYLFSLGPASAAGYEVGGFWIILLIAVAVFFAIGSLIGWIIGKIGGKKK